jgi:hypothetical protein
MKGITSGPGESTPIENAIASGNKKALANISLAPGRIPAL